MPHVNESDWAEFLRYRVEKENAPTPDTDTKWDRDARAALTGLLASGKVSPEYLRLNIPVYIEILASLRATERARRKEAGE